MLDLERVYEKLPVNIQTFFCNVEGWRLRRQRYGPLFDELLSQYDGRSGWNGDQIAEFRDERLRNLISHCYETVPYYSKLFQSLGILPKDIDSLEDLQLLPVVDKKTVQNNYRDFVSSKVTKSNLITVHTSGTTGAGFKFEFSKEALVEQLAVIWRYRGWLSIPIDSW